MLAGIRAWEFAPAATVAHREGLVPGGSDLAREDQGRE